MIFRNTLLLLVIAHVTFAQTYELDVGTDTIALQSGRVLVRMDSKHDGKQRQWVYATDGLGNVRLLTGGDDILWEYRDVTKFAGNVSYSGTLYRVKNGRRSEIPNVLNERGDTLFADTAPPCNPFFAARRGGLSMYFLVDDQPVEFPGLDVTKQTNREIELSLKGQPVFRWILSESRVVAMSMLDTVDTSIKWGKLGNAPVPTVISANCKVPGAQFPGLTVIKMKWSSEVPEILFDRATLGEVDPETLELKQ